MEFCYDEFKREWERIGLIYNPETEQDVPSISDLIDILKLARKNETDLPVYIMRIPKKEKKTAFNAEIWICTHKEKECSRLVIVD